MSQIFHASVQMGQKLGNGHFGEVYEAQDLVHGKVAVKVISREKALRPEHVNDDARWHEVKSAFQAEARFLSVGSHRNVVPVYHIHETPDGNHIQFCMAYCPGGSLESIYAQGPMPVDTVRKVGTEVLMGLNALHTRGMLHRDIKPGNILIDADGVAQISDFGLVTDDLILGYASQAGYRDHIAFEIWQGGLTSVRSDIWAFGMTIFRLLHGQAWYDEAIAPRYIINQGGFADTLRWLPHIPTAWKRVVRTMLRDDPAARYQSAVQAQHAFARLPTIPAWKTSVSPTMLEWELAKGNRLQRVQWRKHSDRKHEWKAWSEPVGAGRPKTLGGSNGIIGSRQALSELEAYFSG